ncbi:TPA: hypothetical protein HL443_08695 [Escherichia coli]|nr:hypothetical protein [Escherichia coli]EFB5451090.1 hypothetical protein [Escherichia coli O157]EEV5583299.1 hypothetical protein [Escherichia coli]EEV5874102.1 hypothetical protein [Escherichia coli]EEV6131536.1 hypothetical protein [Escherichia coli]
MIEEGLSRSDQSHIYQRMQMKKSFPAFPHISMIKRNVTISWPKLTNQPGIIARDLRISMIIATKKLLRSMK